MHNNDIKNITESQIFTFGCRLNFLESQVIKDHLKNLDQTDVVVVHTCSVTKNADKESYQKVKELIQQKITDGKKVYVTGCSAQLYPDKYLALGVDRVIGNADKLEESSYAQISEPKIWRDISQVKMIDRLPSTIKIDGKTRGLVQIQNGCDHDCTFCVIHIARGKNRSVKPVQILNLIEMMISAGCKEIVLTGVDITDYGKDFMDHKINLAGLVRKILSAFPSLHRLRFSSIDVAEIDQELFEIIISQERLMPYIHLSMQSGSDLILKRMKRRHLSDQIRNFCLSALHHRPEIVFGADIIAGFPTETDELFEQTRHLICEIPNFIHLHIFPFSAHVGTPAARMPQVPALKIKERAKILREIGADNKLKFAQRLVNTDQKVLFENDGSGYTSQFLKFKLQDHNEKGHIGEIMNVKILGLEQMQKSTINKFCLSGLIVA